MHAMLEITDQERAKGAHVVTVKGDVTIHTSPQLRKALKPLLTAATKEVRVQLDGVGFMDSSGIATLVEGLQWARETGGRFVLSGLSETVRDVFELAKLDTVFEIDNGSASHD